MDITVSLSLIAIIIGIIANISLSVLVFKNDSKSRTNQIFCALSFAIAVWSLSNYLSVDRQLINYSLFLIRLSIFFAAPMSALFFILAHTIPHKKIQLSRTKILLIVIFTLLVMLVNISPFAFVDVSIKNGSPSPIAGPGILPFAILSTFFSIAAVYVLIKKLRRSSDIEKQQLRFVMLGILFMLGLIISTVFIPVAIFRVNLFVSFIPLYTLIFLGLTAYAIVKHHLFNIKVIATEVLIVIIWLVLFARIFVSPDLSVIMIDGLVLAIMIPFGIFLIRSVIKEVERAEERYELIATVSHQLRTPLTPIVGLSSMLVAGDFDKDSSLRKETEKQIYDSSLRLRNVINDFLQMFQVEEGGQVAQTRVDLVAVIREAMENVKTNYQKKGLQLVFNKQKDMTFETIGYDRLIIQAISNILDNAEKYTKKGGTTITLKKGAKSIIISIADTGIGIRQEDKDHMFQRFFRSNDARQIRPEGSGLGLPIVKRIIETHGGKITFESAGENNGTTFIISFPLRV